jgi:hypothetical protein
MTDKFEIAGIFLGMYVHVSRYIHCEGFILFGKGDHVMWTMS